MNISKLQEAIKELEAEGNRVLRIAGELKEVVKRSGNGIDHSPSVGRSKSKKSATSSQEGIPSQLVVAVEVLRELRKPTHISELVPLVADRRKGATTTRGTVESALVRGMKAGRFKNVIRRTAPGTFEAH